MNKQKKNLICKGCGESIGEIWGSEDPQLAPESGNEKEMHSENHEPMTFCGPACVEKYKSETKWNPDEGTQEMNQMNDYTDGKSKASEYYADFNQYTDGSVEKDEKGNVVLDIGSNAAYVSYKERNSPTTKYIDEKRKSFPYRKGHECTDLEAASKAFGRYKGSMSHDTFKAKVKRLMKEHGCPIPKAWSD